MCSTQTEQNNEQDITNELEEEGRSLKEERVRGRGLERQRVKSSDMRGRGRKREWRREAERRGRDERGRQRR